MINILKEILFWIALTCGSVSLICLIFCGTWRCVCIFLDHCKNANMLRKIIKDYIKNKTNYNIREADIINLRKMGIERGKKNDSKTTN